MGFANATADFPVIHLIERREWRGVMAGDFNSGIRASQTFDSPRRHIRFTAKKENAITFFRSHRQQLGHEVRARNAFRQWIPEPA